MTQVYRGIGNSISYRAGLMNELAMKMAEQDIRDKELRGELLKLAPAFLHKWLSEDLVLTSLFKFGRYDTKIVFGDMYNFKNVADTRQKIKMLAEAWDGVVLIQLGIPDGTPKPHRIPICLSAIM